MKQKHFAVIFLLLISLYACKKATEQNYFTGFQQPVGFPTPAYKFENNPVTQARFELGRKLFYDPLLSGNNTISCGSCHIQSSAFTQHGHSVSHGIFDRDGTRNSPPIMNLAWQTGFMWDGGVNDLDLQPLVPISSHVEMEDSISHVLNKLRNSTNYPSMFNKAFGSDEINSTKFLKALSQFMLMCVSSNSKYDSVKRNQSSFSDIEMKGYTTFKQKCNSCHKEPLFTDNSFRNNGLSISSINDKGRYEITNNTSDQYKFKVPSLRNLNYTAPYMHDGRLLTLDAVLDHYNNQVQNTLNLDPLLQSGTQLGIALSVEERTNLTAFLKTLDDKVFINNRNLAEQ